MGAPMGYPIFQRGNQMKSAPTNLDELLQMIMEYNNPNHVGNYMSAEEFVDHKTIPPWDGAPMVHGELDMTELPRFGWWDNECEGSWSWDDTRMLVGDGNGLEIVSRK